MKDLIITINADTRKVTFNRDFIGLTGENLQGNIVVDFKDKADFINGSARFEVDRNGEKYFITMSKTSDKTYTIPIKSSLLSNACIMKCQVVISQAETANGIPVFKTETFNLPCNESLNAEGTIPEQYPTWLEEANKKLEEVDEALAKVESVAKFVTPEMFGAVGDGETDDTLAIQEAINATTDGMTLKFTSHKYLIDTLKQKDEENYGYCGLLFFKKNNIIVDFNNTEITVATNADNASIHNAIRISACNNCHFKNLTLRGELDEHIFADGNKHASVTKAYKKTMYGFVIRSVAMQGEILASTNIIAENIHAYNFVASSIHVGDNAGHGTTEVPTQYITLLNCTGRHSGYHGIVVEGASNVVLDGCKAYDAYTIKENYGCGADIEGISDDKPNENIIVRNCEFGTAEVASLGIHKNKNIIIHDCLFYGSNFVIQNGDDIEIRNNTVKTQLSIQKYVPKLNITNNVLNGGLRVYLSNKNMYDNSAPNNKMILTVMGNVIYPKNAEQGKLTECIQLSLNNNFLFANFYNNTVHINGGYQQFVRYYDMSTPSTISPRITFKSNKFIGGSSDTKLTEIHGSLFDFRSMSVDFIDNSIDVYFGDSITLTSGSEFRLFNYLFTVDGQEFKALGNTINLHNLKNLSAETRVLWLTKNPSTLEFTGTACEINNNYINAVKTLTGYLMYSQVPANCFYNVICSSAIYNNNILSSTTTKTLIGNILNGVAIN